MQLLYSNSANFNTQKRSSGYGFFLPNMPFYS